MPHTVLLPCAGPLTSATRPHWLLTTPQGELAIGRAIRSIPESDIGRVVIGLSDEADKRFGAGEAIRRCFEDISWPSPDIIIIEQATRGPAHTIEVMIERAGVEGAIAIKDADSLFTIQSPLPGASFTVVCDLRENLEIPRVGEKSFVRLNEQNFVNDIVEKEVSSNLVSVGLYGFADANLFKTHYIAAERALHSSAIFISHVMSSAIDAGEVVIPVTATNYVEVDSNVSWHAFRERHMTLVLDIDGVVFENHSRFFPPFWEEEDKPIEANVNHLLKLQQNGAQLIFMTARPDKYRQKTLNALRKLGIDVHALITGCNHGRRYLINDFAASNPYPSATSINLTRNSPDLPKMIG